MRFMGMETNLEEVIWKQKMIHGGWGDKIVL
jgi:hypothetical protein